ncbi:MAG: DUF3991 and toprim domain-containing protein [Oscillospiraceae bacterium]|nr:DUF3991 and toprim domain-containing protein [Oscillospiraceae bacterium]
MRINDNILVQARTADVLAFFEKYNGYTFAHRGGEYRCKQHPSLAVKADRLSWYWHSKGIGGYGVIDYLVKVEDMAFRQAVEVVTGATPQTAPTQQAAELPPKTLILPEKAGIMLRLYDYLCMKRGIDGDVVNTLIQEEKLYEDRRGNVVFVGHDEPGTARFASLRGTHGDYRGDCSGSDKRYGFQAVFAPCERVYVFESPIDLMSDATLTNAATGDTEAWKQDSRLSLSGTSDTALQFFLNQHREVKEIVLCLDNDQAGHEAAAHMARKYAAKGYTVLIDFPQGKDFNADLTEKIRLEKGLKNAVKMHKETSL